MIITCQPLLTRFIYNSGVLFSFFIKVHPFYSDILFLLVICIFAFRNRFLLIFLLIKYGEHSCLYFVFISYFQPLLFFLKPFTITLFVVYTIFTSLFANTMTTLATNIHISMYGQPFTKYL